MVAFDEPADLIGSCEATLDTLGLLVGDMSEEVQDRGGAWTIAQILNHLLDTERRYYGRVRRMRKEVEAEDARHARPRLQEAERAAGLDAVLRAAAASPQAAALAEA